MSESNHADFLDVSITYALHDKAAVVEPLVSALEKLGVSVQAARTEICDGHRLRDSVDEAVSWARYGVLVLSPSFLAMNHLREDLDRAAHLQWRGRLILPIWRDVRRTEVRERSPDLADRIAAHWSDGIESVVARVLAFVRPDVVQRARKSIPRHESLSRLSTGDELLAVISNAHRIHMFTDVLGHDADWDLAEKLVALRDWIRTQNYLDDLLHQLERANWSLFGKRLQQHLQVAATSVTWTAGVLRAARGTDRSVAFAEAELQPL